MVAVRAEGSSAVFLGYLFEFPEERECINLVETHYDVGLEGLSLSFVRVVVLVGDEVSICLM